MSHYPNMSIHDEAISRSTSTDIKVNQSIDVNNFNSTFNSEFDKQRPEHRGHKEFNPTSAQVQYEEIPIITPYYREYKTKQLLKHSKLHESLVTCVITKIINEYSDSDSVIFKTRDDVKYVSSYYTGDFGADIDDVHGTNYINFDKEVPYFEKDVLSEYESRLTVKVE